MSEHTAVDELDALIEELVHALDGIHVRRRSIEELAPYEQSRIVGMLRPFLPLVTGVCERIDAKLSVILNAKLDEEDA